MASVVFPPFPSLAQTSDVPSADAAESRRRRRRRNRSRSGPRDVRRSAQPGSRAHSRTARVAEMLLSENSPKTEAEAREELRPRIAGLFDFVFEDHSRNSQRLAPFIDVTEEAQQDMLAKLTHRGRRRNKHRVPVAEPEIVLRARRNATHRLKSTALDAEWEQLEAIDELEDVGFGIVACSTGVSDSATTGATASRRSHAARKRRGHNSTYVHQHSSKRGRLSFAQMYGQLDRTCKRLLERKAFSAESMQIVETELRDIAELFSVSAKGHEYRGHAVTELSGSFGRLLVHSVASFYGLGTSTTDAGRLYVLNPKNLERVLTAFDTVSLTKELFALQ